jgi:hypothetical protein
MSTTVLEESNGKSVLRELPIRTLLRSDNDDEDGTLAVDSAGAASFDVRVVRVPVSLLILLISGRTYPSDKQPRFSSSTTNDGCCEDTDLT